MKPIRKNPPEPILAVDDEEDVLQSYRATLRAHGINNVRLCADSREVVTLMTQGSYSAVILDLYMPHVSGQQLLEHVHADYPNVPVIVVTGSNEVSTAVECMKAGAFDFMVKPVDENRLVASVRHAIDICELQQENRELSRQLMGRRLRHPEAFGRFVTVSESLRSVFGYIEAIAPSPRPVLVTGESGTGKELIARAIHGVSDREGEFVAVNVAGLEDAAFSDSLFGHRKGAFTGATSDRQGLVERAAGGTLFLDEIGSLEAPSQTKLLRLLQEKEYYPLGSDIQKRANVAIVAATNEDLRGLRDDGRFRADLYYRLMTHHIHIPPLRERIEDIPFLVEHFLDETAGAMGTPRCGVPDGLYELLSGYSFRGNVRELQSMVHDAAVRAEGGTLDLSLFQGYIRSQTGGGPAVSESVDEDGSISYLGQFPKLRKVEEYFIAEAMRRSGGNQSAAARMLGISQSTLSRRFKERSAEESP
ncbi:MAG: response regulator [Chitinivibrionales bacterium]|nr:response regulator [Chitinivibrionales bacterium]